MFFCGGIARGAEPSAPQPLPRAHAHNDYRHPRPLLDALDHGFCNVEADVYLVDGELLVGHDRDELRPERTLKALYLDPLRARAKRYDGHIQPGAERFTLLIDFKSAGPETYQALHKLLASYADMLTSVADGRTSRRAVDVVISGNRPLAEVAKTSPRYAGVDGRISELDASVPANLVPLVSDNWRNYFSWRGEGPLPEAQREKLRDVVERVHGQGRRLRFWATPDDPRVWRALDRAGVDVIGTDDLGALERYFTARAATAKSND